MDKTIVVGLAGHPGRYRLDEAAHDRLEQYLDRAATRLHDDPERAEVLGDLECSVGDKLAVLLGSGDRVLTGPDIAGVLEEIGAIDTGHDPQSAEDRPRPRARHLQRIRQGQQVAGVCNGIAAYAQLDVSWVRLGFLAATTATARVFAIVYFALAFMLPVTAAREAADA